MRNGKEDPDKMMSELNKHMGEVDVSVTTKMIKDFLVLHNSNEKMTFSTYVINSQEYKARMNTMYSNTFRHMIGNTATEPIAKDVTEFMKTITEHPATSEDAVAHIVPCATYIKEVTGCFNRSVLASYGTVERTVVNFLSKAATDYVASKLAVDHAEMTRIMLEQSKLLELELELELDIVDRDTGDATSLINKKYAERSAGIAPDETLIATALKTVGDVGKCVDMFLDIGMLPFNPIVVEIETSFAKVYGRDITITEFVKHLGVNIHTPIKDVEEAINGTHGSYTIAIATAKKIYSDFLKIELSEACFIATFLHSYAVEGWAEDLVTAIVIGKHQPNLYENCMRSVITNIYSDTFRTTILEHNLSHMFEIARLKKFSTMSGDLAELVAHVNDMSKMYVTSMTRVFQTVIRRDPDEVEVTMYISIYRKNEPNPLILHSATKNEWVTKTEAQIIDVLYDSMEYNMVLRDKIGTLCQTNPLLPSTLYRLVTEITADPIAKRSDEIIAERTKRTLNSEAAQ
jgi:hypothetical protein